MEMYSQDVAFLVTFTCNIHYCPFKYCTFTFKGLCSLKNLKNIITVFVTAEY